jgi:hypothetical protein
MAPLKLIKSGNARPARISSRQSLRIVYAGDLEVVHPFSARQPEIAGNDVDEPFQIRR